MNIQRTKQQHFALPTRLIILLSLFVVPQFVIADYDEPADPPQAGPAKTFLNASSREQRKAGSLLIGSSTRTSKFCLNPVNDQSIHSSANASNCIDAWSDLGTLTGSFIQRQQNTVPTSATNHATYGVADAGFATVWGNGTNNQFLSTVVKVTDTSFPTTYAVYATDGGSATRYAAQFSGKTIIRKATAPSGTVDLCLNGQCIDSWADVASFAATAVIRLQPNTVGDGTPVYLNSDAGNASVTGVLYLQRGLTAGRPTPLTSTTWTNTDGQCTSENGETFANSPLDCS